MNLCIDQGNSSVKAAVFDGSSMIRSFVFSVNIEDNIKSIVESFEVKNIILSSVSSNSIADYLTELSSRLILFSHKTPVPVVNKYKTPETLGKDRLAAVIGASWLMPGTDLLVIDAGTAITYDFIDSEGVYHGGNIAPGLSLRLKSLHQNTGKLPLVEFDENVDFLGNDTRSAIQAGVLYGVVHEIDGYIDSLLLKYPKLCTFLTGGSSIYFVNKLKNRIFADKNLVLTGLNRILEYNAS